MDTYKKTRVEGVVTNSRQRVPKLHLPSVAEQQQFLMEWNHTPTESLQDMCIHQLFEAQVELTPDAVAVVYENKQLTYRQLNCRANQLAYHLRSLGIGPEVLVGICMERSLEMVVGLLGILKAGGAYVPLDPAYPRDRLAFILEDTQTPVMLTQQKFVERLPSHTAQVVCLDSDWTLIAQNSLDNLICEATSNNLAYVIYTSGSTGQPKGVMIPHSGIYNQLYWRQTTFKLTEQDKVLQNISFSFDPSVWQIFWPLSFGAQLIMARSGGHKDAAYLVKTIIDLQITVIALVPSMLRVLLQQPGIENCKSLKHITCGGEALSVEIIECFFNKLNLENVLINCYGPTEASIDATFWTCQRGNHQTIAPIGHPITNAQIYILDEHLQPVPVGEPGELHIGGVGLARGYLNRPDLTAQKFIPNPYSCENGARLYKTGDLARYMSDGNIAFLGRIDDQVKIRGFRIELGEIEALLSQHPALQQSLVMAREDIPGDKRLVGYVVVKPNQALPSQSELHHFLQEQLPDYMVPTAFVYLDKLPLNPNGKVDRRVLPAPDISSLKRSSNFVAPSTPTEEVLVAIWSQVLGLQQIGIKDNFFELGGNSLLAMQVISRLRQAFGVEVPLQLLFEKPTISVLASQLLNRNTNSKEHRNIPRRINQRSAELSFAQARLWFLAQLEPDSAAYNIVEAVQLQGKLNVDALQKSLDAIVAHHEALRTNFIASDKGIPLQVIGLPQPVELMVIDLTQEEESNQHEQVQRILKLHAQRPFNLATDLMLRTTLLQIDQQKHILLLVMHHIASDGWSMGILWQQLATVYEALLNNKSNPLPKLPIQYADFAVWQRQCLSDEVLSSKLEYWKAQLAGTNHVLELPTDQPRPAIQTYRGATQSLMLPQALTRSLVALSQQESVTLFMTLLAVFGTLLHRYTGQDDVNIGSPFAGRDRLELEELIGFFINTVVLRLNFSGHPSFRLLLSRVREVVLGAYKHQDVPFEKLVEELQPERDTSRNPLFQVWFNMLNLGDIQLELPGLSCEPISMPEPASMFDLSFYVVEQKQGIQIKLVYNADLFGPERMTQMLEQFNHLLVQIVENPDVSIADLSLVTPKAQSLLPNPQQPLDPQWQGAVHTFFSEQARRVPQQLAVVDTQFSWTYAELERCANQVANYLLAHKIQSQDIIAIYGHRSATLIVSILGVLKAGAAFVILDPAYPTARLMDCLKLVQPCGWLQITAVGELPKEVQEYTDLFCKCSLQLPSPSMATIHSLLQDYTTTDPRVTVEADHLAYVAFTSGSTGKPKGITGTHQPLSHFIQWHIKTFDLNQSDKFSLLSGLSHDPLLRDIFTPLSLGATLCIPDQKDIETSGQLAIWMQQMQISIAHLTPAMAQLLTANTTTITTDLRYVFFAGDVLTQQEVSRIRRFAPLSTCVNYYGATETPQAMGYFIIPNDSWGEVSNFKQTIPLGRGIEDVQLLVFTSKLQLAGIGEIGEIYVRTPYLASGYIGNDEAQERFMLNPLTKKTSDKLYKTGDIGRYLPDGNIEFLGRSDYQVKIRGFRIELGEIEATLSQHPGVQKTVAIARENISGDKQLLAYVVPKSKPVCTTEKLRHFLKEKLPSYMIPTAFVMLESLPLTPNGKVDRRALPVPEEVRQEEQTFVPPRDHLESQLVQIWQQVLGIQRIGIRDNFFDLGGHSLLAIKLFAQIQTQFHKKLPITTLFRSGTVEALANILRQEIEKPADHQVLFAKQEYLESTWSSLVAIQPNGFKPPLFCIHALGGGVLCYHSLALQLGSDQPVYGLQPRGLDGKEPPLTQVEDMAAHYIREIQTIQPNGPYFLAGYSFGGMVAFEMAQQLQSLGEKVGLLAMLDTCVPNSSTRLPFRKRVLVHVDNLLEQGPTYLRHKLAGWSEHGKHNLREKYMHFLGIKEPLPEDDKHLEIMDANVQAISKYTLQVYSGQIVLFRTDDKSRTGAVGEQYDLQFGWGSVVSGGIEIHYIPGAHNTFLLEPHVRVLAEKLKDCLKKAQILCATEE
jgi:amino acid adenylation domain-containing protein